MARSSTGVIRRLPVSYRSRLLVLTPSLVGLGDGEPRVLTMLPELRTVHHGPNVRPLVRPVKLLFRTRRLRGEPSSNNTRRLRRLLLQKIFQGGPGAQHVLHLGYAVLL